MQAEMEIIVCQGRGTPQSWTSSNGRVRDWFEHCCPSCCWDCANGAVHRRLPYPGRGLELAPEGKTLPGFTNRGGDQ